MAKPLYFFKSATAYTSHPSPLPTKPSFSVVVAFTDTCEMSIPITEAMHSRIGMIYGASFGFCMAMVMSTFATDQPSARTSDITRESRILLSMPANSSEVSGKCLPMSPSASAPRRASHKACMATSPSECAMQPMGLSTCTPPSHKGSPGASACTSYPFPILISIYFDSCRPRKPPKSWTAFHFFRSRPRKLPKSWTALHPEVHFVHKKVPCLRMLTEMWRILSANVNKNN